MFECNDDIDVDDGFLNTVFETEEDKFGIISTPRRESQLVNRNPCLQHSIFSSNESPNNFNEAVTPGRSVNSDLKSSVGLHSPFGSNFQSDDDFFINSGNKENKRRHETSPPVRLKSKRERKFPGPAGLLPDRKSCRVMPVKLDFLPENENSPSSPTPEEFGSQGRCSGSVLEEEPWQSLLADLGPDRSILDTINVASIKRKVAARCFVGRKVPFLAAVLHHLDVSSPDPCIVLRDTSGEIHGIVHREVWEQFAGELVVGSVLVVREVGLLSTGASSRRHYLSITANNLATIYSCGPDKPRKTRLHTFTPQDYLKTVEKWRTLVSPSHGMGSSGSPTLFNTSRGSSVCSSPMPGPSSAADHGNGPRLNQIRQSPNTRQPSFQTVRNSNNYTLGRSPRPTFPSTGAPRTCTPNLSFGPKQNSNITVSPCNSRIINNANQPKPLLSKEPERNFIQSVNNMHTNSFVFNPVNVKPKRFGEDIFPYSNSDRQLKDNVQSPNPSVSLGINRKASLVLSQSSQLSAEEQSLVESVFDGIDADSLFDDDF